MGAMKGAEATGSMFQQRCVLYELLNASSQTVPTGNLTNRLAVLIGPQGLDSWH